MDVLARNPLSDLSCLANCRSRTRAASLGAMGTASRSIPPGFRTRFNSPTVKAGARQVFEYVQTDHDIESIVGQRQRPVKIALFQIVVFGKINAFAVGDRIEPDPFCTFYGPDKTLNNAGVAAHPRSLAGC